MNLDVKSELDQALEAVALALEMRNRETPGHTSRVCEVTLALARAMHIPQPELVHIRRGALLHDIGKLAIPESILLKPDPLTDEEWEVIRKHPEHAVTLLVHIEELRQALDIPYCHHENWDGSGYPRGLKGPQIPLPARIFAVVNIWDSLNSDRPYRPRWFEKDIIQHIGSLVGSQLDPTVVVIFFSPEMQQQLSSVRAHAAKE